MDGRREDDLSAIAWPGFVDILSAVIIMFVFFVMVTAVALYFHTITYKSKFKQLSEQVKTESVKAESNESMAERAKSLEKRLKIVTEEKESLEHILADFDQEMYQMRAEFTESENQKVMINAAKKEIVIFFGIDSISITQESDIAVKEYLRAELTKSPDLSIQLISNKPQTALNNVAQTLASYRLFNTRNIMLDLEMNTMKVKAKVLQDGDIDGSTHWVKIRVVK